MKEDSSLSIEANSASKVIDMKRMDELTVEETLKLYNKAKELQSLGYGYVKTSRMLGVSKFTLANWMCRGKFPLENVNLANLTPSPELSYVIGVVKGDGTCFKTTIGKSYRICLASKDIEFVQNFRNKIKKILIKNARLPIWEERKNFYKIQVGSKHFYEFLIDSPLKVVEEFPRDFLRGFFDSEGCVSSSLKKYPYAIRVSCSNSNEDIIKFVRKLLLELGIATKMLVYEKMKNATKPHYVIRIYGLENVKKFAEFIGFSIERKNKKLLEALRIWLKKRKSKKKI